MPEEFFRADIANLVQVVSFFLETVALILIILELFYPKKADGIEDWLDNLGLKQF